jgi:hypothetical protein
LNEKAVEDLRSFKNFVSLDSRTVVLNKKPMDPTKAEMTPTSRHAECLNPFGSECEITLTQEGLSS